MDNIYVYLFAFVYSISIFIAYRWGLRDGLKVFQTKTLPKSNPITVVTEKIKQATEKKKDKPDEQSYRNSLSALFGNNE